MIARRQWRLLALAVVTALPALGVYSLPASAERPAAGGPVLKLDHPLYCLALSPDGKALAYGDYAHVVVRDCATGKELSKVSLGEGHAECVAVAFSPDGKRLASVWADPTAEKPDSICLWDVGTRNELRDPMSLPIPKEKQSLSRGAPGPYLPFSSDGKMLATRHRGGETIVWDVAGGKERLCLPTHGLPAAFTADGRTLISVRRDGLVQHWDLATKKCFTPGGETGRKDFLWVERVSASEDGRTVTLSDGYSVVLKDTRSGKTLRRFDEAGDARDPHALSPDGKTLALGGDLYDSATGKERASFDEGLWAVFSPHGKYLAVVKPAGEVTQSVSVWDADKLPGPTGREAESAPASGPLEAKLTSAKDTYVLDLGGKTPEEFARLIDAPPGKPFPPAPEVDLVLTLRNVSGKKLTIFANPGLDISLAGDGAMNHPAGLYSAEEDPLPVRPYPGEKVVALAPGETHSVPVKSLDIRYLDATRGRRSYWLLPGEYVLRASCLAACDPREGGTFTTCQIEAPPLRVKVVAGKK